MSLYNLPRTAFGRGELMLVTEVPGAIRAFATPKWRALSLSQQFLTGTIVVLVAGMAGIGWWLSERTASAVKDHTAHTAALYMEGSVAPLLQELASQDELSAETIERLDALLAEPTIRATIVSMKVWRSDGTIVYSKWRQMIGQNFPPSANFKAALAGRVAVEFETETTPENMLERAVGGPLLEIYAPVRAKDSRRVIAVSEFYADGEKLARELRSAAVTSWLIVGGVTTLMLAALSGIVYRGSRTIDDQRDRLREQVVNLEHLLGQNEVLRERLKETSARIADIYERTLQRVGADLHDGPAQLLTYQLLRLNKLAPLIEQAAGANGLKQLEQMRSAIAETLTEVRGVSAGLSLPQLASVSFFRVIGLAVTQHEERTGTKVEVEAGDITAEIPLPLKIGAYRLVQEALTNSFRHAAGKGQRVQMNIASPDRGPDRLEVIVSDSGPGFTRSQENGAGLGLTGMQARVEALGGKLEIASKAGNGTRVAATFELENLDEKA